MTPWLSLLFPMYRVEPWLAACLASLLPQIDDGVELIFVDDASPDASGAIVASLHDPRARLVRLPANAGVSAARNRLLDEARGEYLWFIDPDDLIEPGVVPRLKALLAQHRPDLLTCDFRVFDDGPSTESTKPRHRHIASFAGPSDVLMNDMDLRLRGLFMLGQFHPWSKVVRRACWPAGLRFPEGRVFEDMAVYPRLVLHTPRHLHVSEVWVAYRQREGSLLAALDARRLDDWTWALDGYAADLPPLNGDTLFEIAHFCARTQLRAKRRRLQLGGPALKGLALDAERFGRSSPLSRRELLAAYFKRGRWLRGLQWWRDG